MAMLTRPQQQGGAYGFVFPEGVAPLLRATTDRLSGVSAVWRQEILNQSARVSQARRPVSLFDQEAYFDIDEGPVDVVQFVAAPDDDTAW